MSALPRRSMRSAQFTPRALLSPDDLARDRRDRRANTPTPTPRRCRRSLRHGLAHQQVLVDVDDAGRDSKNARQRRERRRRADEARHRHLRSGGAGGALRGRASTLGGVQGAQAGGSCAAPPVGRAREGSAPRARSRRAQAAPRAAAPDVDGKSSPRRRRRRLAPASRFVYVPTEYASSFSRWRLCFSSASTFSRTSEKAGVVSTLYSR